MVNRNSRTFNSMRNIIVSVGCQLASLVLSFVTRTLFIHVLGADYLGINGLFSNILTVMSLADLGFGTAIVYTLYKPLVENNQKKISAIVGFYGKIYNVVAVLLLVVGLALIPFLKYFINLENDIPFLKLYYVLFLLDLVCSYLFVYKSAVLEADQKNYIVKINRTIFLLAGNIIKLVVLYATHNYILFLIVQIVCTLASNISIYVIAENKFPFLKSNKEKLDKAERNGIIDNVKSLFLYKIGGVILNNTDNILISILVSTTVVGYYSNYYLLFGTVVTFSEIIFGALNASVGNLNASKSKEELSNTFDMINFANFWIYGFCAISLYCLLDDFIYLWLGQEYVLGSLTSLVICINVFMPGMLSAVACFRNATGLFKQTKYVFCVTAALNLLLSIWFGKLWGLNGILFATAVSRLLTNVWYEPYVLIKIFFKRSYVKYVAKLLLYYIITGLSIFGVYCVKELDFVVTWMSFICEFLICVFGINLLFVILFCRTEEFKGLFQRILPIVKKILCVKEKK